MINIFSKRANEEAKLIVRCFALLDRFEKGISKEIADYVIEGKNSSVISKLRNLPADHFKAATIFIPEINLMPSDLIEQSFMVRSCFADFYMTEALSDIHLAKRWSDVLLTFADVQSLRVNFQVESPDWLKVLFWDVVDRFRSAFNSRNFKFPSYLNARWLAALLNEHDVDQLVWLAILLEREGSMYRRGLEKFTEGANWPLLLKSDQVVQKISVLHVSGRIELAKILNNLNEDLNSIVPAIVLFLCDTSKLVRESFVSLFGKVDASSVFNYIKGHFDSFSTTQRKELARFVAIQYPGHAEEYLSEVLKAESSQSVKEVIHALLSNKNAASETSNKQLELPPYSRINLHHQVPPHWFFKLKQAHKTELERAEEVAVAERESNVKNQESRHHWQEHYERALTVTGQQLEQALEFLATGQGALVSGNAQWIISRARLSEDPEFSLGHILRYMRSIHSKSNSRSAITCQLFRQWVELHPGVLTDLRQLGDALLETDFDPRGIASWVIGSRGSTDFILPNTAGMSVWPFFAHHETYLNEAFGILDNGSVYNKNFELGMAMRVVQKFPVIPERYLQILYEHAFSVSKVYGPLAREIITGYGVVERRLEESLQSSKREERIVAANWISDLKLKNAVPWLEKAIQAEKQETAKAAFLSALHNVGGETAKYLAPAALLKEAVVGLKKSIPEGLNNFPFELAPELRWVSGEAIPSDTLKWWIVLACKLKSPGGNPLLNLYLSQLDERSREAFGLYILNSFVEKDTATASDEEAHEHAEANKQQCLENWLSCVDKYEWGEKYRNKTLEDAYNSLYQRKKSICIGSALEEKGILALASFAKASEAVRIIQRYMREHPVRRHQIEAMLSSIANAKDLAAIQFLLSIARRHRTKSIMLKARALIDEYAESNAWTQDELADRTIPTAGLEADGRYTYDLGERKLTVVLGADLKLSILNEQGIELKSFPESRESDDSEQYVIAKKDFSANKQELKQVIALQTKRFAELMCIERKWFYRDWEVDLFQHPIVRHLIQRLVWQVEESGDIYYVRPTLDHSLVDLSGKLRKPNADAFISIAHISQCGKEVAIQWQKRFKSEKLKPLLLQFEMSTHMLDEKETDQRELNYRKGWLTDAFSIRSELTKLEYQRFNPESGFFNGYHKDFVGAGIRINIEFSGNTLPEGNVSAALTRLYFTPLKKLWIMESDHLVIKSVPKVLLNEGMLAYEKIAQKGVFDPEWAQKVPWSSGSE